jgi:broad specificity phosphatase PhoE
MAFRLLLVRHGQTAWNVAGRIQGHTDEPLDDVGLRQAARLAERLADEAIHAAYASTSERTWRTAEIALGGRGIAVTRDDVWREASYGEWEGLTWAEINARYPEHAARRRADPATVAPPGGEHFSDLAARLVPAVEALRGRHDGQSVLVVTHGGCLRVLASSFTGTGVEGDWRFRADNCALSILRWSDASGLPAPGAIVDLWNETAYLRGLHRG